MRPDNWNEDDAMVVKSLRYELLDQGIEFLRSYKKVEWEGLEESNVIEKDEAGYAISYKEQPVPRYPLELLQVLSIFGECPEMDYRFKLRQAGMLQSKSFEEAYREMTPSLIYCYFMDCYDEEASCLGFFGEGVENGNYLRALLKLKHDANRFLSSTGGRYGMGKEEKDADYLEAIRCGALAVPTNPNWMKEWLPFIKHDYPDAGMFLVALINKKLSLVLEKDKRDLDKVFLMAKQRRVLDIRNTIILGKKILEGDRDIKTKDAYFDALKELV